MSRLRNGPSSFETVLKYAGNNKAILDTQNGKRHYSERFSQDVAEWFAGYLRHDIKHDTLLPPESPIKTSFGTKRLDIGCVDPNGYLSLDVSIKTFHFRDQRTKKYNKNFTGRFYELLGESLDLHRSYPLAVLAAIIILPIDSCNDSLTAAPSSFGCAVRQFSKISGRIEPEDDPILFEHVFIGLYNSNSIAFFNAMDAPPKQGIPERCYLISIEELIGKLIHSTDIRKATRNISKMREQRTFSWAKPI